MSETKPNLIATRIADFLKRFPPFEYLSSEEILELANAALVRYYGKGDYVFNQGHDGGEFLFMVQEGAVHLELEENSTKTLVDVCDEGDVLGVRAMITKKPYAFHARCEEESLLYAIPVSLFSKHLETNSKIALFFASGLASGQKLKQANEEDVPLPAKESGSLLNWNRPLAQPSRPLISASPSDSIKEVAERMTNDKIGSMIIYEDDEIKGIVTDTDFRTKLGTGLANVNQPITELMTKGVFSMPVGQPLSNYLLEMLRRGIRHICLTDTNQKPVGIISEHDLLASQQNHPFTLSFSIEQATEVQQVVDLRNRADDLIKFYLNQNVSIELVSSLITHINDAVINKFIALATSELGDPPVAFAWLSLGSEGRKEQLIRTDQDNALVFEDVEEKDQKATSDYFLLLSKIVTNYLAEAGFEYCPANMMASNPEWCQPLSKWKNYFSGWIKQPQEKSLMLSTIFFDFRKVYGDETLVSQLQEHLKTEIDKSKIFLNFLGANAMKNPAPLSFFKNFVVERSGEHKNEFDIKARAMMPLVDIARLLTLESGELGETNTAARYRKMAKIDVKNKNEYLQAAEAYEYLMKFRALNGFQRPESKRYIQLDQLNKMDKLILRNTFEPIDALQKLITVRFQLNYFN